MLRLSPQSPQVSFQQRLAACCLIWMTLLIVQPIFGQDIPRGFVNKVFHDDEGDHKYVVFVPKAYTPARPAPVILFLHGGGECGKDGTLQTTIGLGPYLTKVPDSFPFLVVFPQCEDTRGRILMRWRPDQPDGIRALKILGDVEKQYKVDATHRSLVGWSMGGYGAVALAATDPKHWSAVVSLSGGGDSEEVAKLKDTPFWAFHGARDTAVKVEESRKLVDALKAAGGKPIYTEVAELDHESYKAAFDRPEFYSWLLNPKITSEPPLLVQPGTKFSPPPVNAPFIPAVHIPRAAYVRLGNDMLQSLGDSIPRIVPADMLTGGIPDIGQTIDAEGRSFSVWFQGISYSAQLYRASVKAYAKDRLNFQLGLANAQLTIGSTSVNGAGKSAQTGPIAIVIGHTRPVWLSFDVKPVILEGRIRLQLLDTRFNIESDNWYVTNPAGISTRGLGMTAERVSSGLIGGLYGQKYRIEAEVKAIVPNLVAQLEQKMSLSEINQVVSTVWPIPVYQPRVRVWPQEISTDDRGITLILGATAAAISAETAPKTPTWAAPAGKGLADVPKTTALTVGMAPSALKPIVAMLVEKKMARINVLDLPIEALKTFADPKQLSDVIPDLKKFGETAELWTELVLSEPLDVVDADGKMQFNLPGLVISVAVKPNKEAKEWQPYAEIRYDVNQPASPSVFSTTQTTRALELSWSEQPTVKASARFAPGYTAENTDIDTAKLEELFQAGWKEWTHSGTASRVAVPDIDLGYCKLRLKHVAWSAPELAAVFGKPGVRITNLSPQSVVYETKGPYSDWSQPYTLKAGDYDAFDIAYPMLFRRTTPDGRIEMFTLPAGSHSEFRVPQIGGKGVQLMQAKETAAPSPTPPDAEAAK
ncbi:MAG: phospholipase/Carboxylesterase [Planctomycetaceae bacterium]|nr:phospholipase/Carboxylesterase [Planctomycetaceae bacterium]